MPDDTRNPTMDSAAGRPAEVASRESLDAWLEEVRASEGSAGQIEAGGPPAKTRRRPRALRPVLMLLVAGGLAYAASVIGGKWRAPATEVTGRLCDPLQRPLAGVRVFLAADARVATQTDASGAFHLCGIPTGRQSLVAVQEDVGEEFVLQAARPNRHDLGELVYHVPPLRVRLGPGGGADWRPDAEQEPPPRFTAGRPLPREQGPSLPRD